MGIRLVADGESFMIEELGLTPEEFQKGFSDFISNRKTKSWKLGQPLDNILKGGIPQGKITMMAGKSNIGTLMHLYIEELVNTKQK